MNFEPTIKSYSDLHLPSTFYNEGRLIGGYLDSGTNSVRF